MNNLLLATSAAIVAAITSLVVAILNLLSTKRLERERQSYTIHIRDLDQLEKLSEKLNEYRYPSFPTLEEIKPDEESKRKLQTKADKISATFVEFAALILRYKSLFSEEFGRTVDDKFKKADEAVGIAGLALQFEFLKFVATSVEKRIAEIRQNLTRDH